MGGAVGGGRAGRRGAGVQIWDCGEVADYA
jgi:hypothetical protein